MVCRTSPPSRTRTQRCLGHRRTRRRSRRRGRCRRGDALAPSSAHTRRLDKAAISRDLEGREFLAIGLGDDQCRVVGRHDHAVGKGDAIRHLTNRAVRRDHSNDSGGELGLGKFKAGVVDVDVAATVHHDFVPRLAGEVTEVSVCDQRAVRLAPQQKRPRAPTRRASARRGASRGRMATSGTRVMTSLLPSRLDGDDLLRHQSENQRRFSMPARRLAQRESCHQGLWFRHSIPQLYFVLPTIRLHLL